MLRTYQEDIVDFGTDRRRINVWAGMGLGKTVSTLTLLDLLSFHEDPFPAIVLAPKRVVESVWPQEVAKWPHLRHLRVVTMTGALKDIQAGLARKAEVYAVNYENIPRMVDLLGDRWPFQTVIADESMNLKSHRAQKGGVRTRALARFAHRDVRRWWNLTGTPGENGLKDLWGPQWFIDRGQRLGLSYQAFSERWFYKTFDGRDILPHDHSFGEICDVLRDCTISMEAKDYFDLPEQVNNTVYVDLPRKFRPLYKRFERDFFLELEKGDVEAVNAAAKSMKCLQMASGAVYLSGEDGGSTGEWEVIHDEKIEALRSIVSEASGENILVAYHFQTDLERLRRAFPDARELDDKPQTIADWNAGRISMLLLHPQSAGHGLNLQDGGRTIVYFSHWWALGPYLQAIERIGPVRQVQSGHPRTVYVHHIVTRGTADEMVMERRAEKRDVLQSLMDTMKRREW